MPLFAGLVWGAENDDRWAARADQRSNLLPSLLAVLSLV